MEIKELIKKLKSNKVMLFDHPIMSEVIQRLTEFDELKDELYHQGIEKDLNT